MIKLGLDASTTTCGWAFVNKASKEILDAGYIDISGKLTNKEKAFAVSQFIKTHGLQSQMQEITIEAALSGFMGGRTSQQVIIKLVKFNAILEYVLQEEFSNIKVDVVNVNTLRKSLFGKCRIAGISSKDYVKMNIETMFDIKKFLKINKVGNPDKRNEDMYDAIVAALY